VCMCIDTGLHSFCGYPTRTWLRRNKWTSPLFLFDGKPKLAHFGSRSHMHYRDKLGHYSALDHNDERRRKLYYARFGPIASNPT
jgi:hypothetical protein